MMDEDPALKAMMVESIEKAKAINPDPETNPGQPLDELKDKGYYYPSLQYHEPVRSWLIEYAKTWGKYLSTPESWKSFNDFFHRYHFPLSGTIKEIEVIAGDDAAGGITVWDEESGNYILECETPGWRQSRFTGSA